jgi:DNA-binding beta-propeller fold protein YncE
VFTPDSKKAYVLDAGIEDTITDTVTPVNTVTNTPGKPIKVGNSPGSMAITPDGRTVYVSSSLGIVPINTATNKAGKALKGLTGPIAITPDGKTAYVSGSRGIVPVNTASNTAGKPIKVAGRPIAITPNGKPGPRPMRPWPRAALLALVSALRLVYAVQSFPSFSGVLPYQPGLCPLCIGNRVI